MERIIKIVHVIIDAGDPAQRYCVEEFHGPRIYAGNEFEKVVEAIQMVNADATFENKG